jgi:hypothetical protein
VRRFPLKTVEMAKICEETEEDDLDFSDRTTAHRPV